MPQDFWNSSIFVFFRFKSYLLKRLLKPIIYISIPTTILCILHEFEIWTVGQSMALPSVLGAALGILLVFRNNTAYERWWEARKALGELVNNSRNFAMQTNQILKEEEDRKRLLSLIAAFPYALKEHLRDGVILSEINFLGEKYVQYLRPFKHKPIALANLIAEFLEKASAEKKLTDLQRVKCLEYLDNSLEIMGKCERIHHTPIPMAHNYLLKFYVFIYTISLPFGFIGVLHWWSIFAVAVIYFLAMSLVAIAEEIEDPFGRDPNDLPVDRIVQNIHRNINEIYASKSGISAIGHVESTKLLAHD